MWKENYWDMKKEYLIGKLNLSPKIIKIFVTNEDSTSDWSQLKHHVIPSVFAEVFDKVEKIQDESTDEYLKINNSIEIKSRENILKSEAYISFLNSFDKTLEEYSSVVDDSNKEGGIFWTEHYISETKIDLRNKLNRLLTEFPYLVQIINNTPDESIIDMLPGNSNFGHGRKYLINGLKIQSYVNNKEISSTILENYEFFYDVEQEQILFNGDKKNFLNILRDISERLNHHKTNIGKVNVLPVFSDMEINKSYKNVTFKVVYPNNPARRSHQNSLLTDTFNESGAQEIELTIESDDDHKFDGTTIDNLAKLFGAAKGYVKDVKNSTRSMLSGEIKKIFKDW